MSDKQYGYAVVYDSGWGKDVEVFSDKDEAIQYIVDTLTEEGEDHNAENFYMYQRIPLMVERTVTVVA